MLRALYFFFVDAKQYCDEIGAIFLETSALTASGVNELFTDISEYGVIFLRHNGLVLFIQ